MDMLGYAAIGVTLALVALGFYSTMRFNRKKPMTREEYDAYENSKKEE